MRNASFGVMSCFHEFFKIKIESLSFILHVILSLAGHEFFNPF